MNVIILGDFNAGIGDEIMKAFCNTYCQRNLSKQPSCLKNLIQPSFINSKLTRKTRDFQTTYVIETILLDFHGMTIWLRNTF